MARLLKKDAFSVPPPSLPEGPAKEGPARPWSVLLAGGEGRRLRSLVQGIHPDQRPKQFATLTGTRSMLQHTCHRALRHSPPERVLVVITKGQERWAFPQLPEIPTRNFIIQPRGLDTAPAICFAVAHIMAYDPQGTLLLFPTDHFIHPEEKLAENVERVLPALDLLTGMSAVLMGARPRRPREGMGWVLPGKSVGHGDLPGFFGVRRFIEKPSPDLVKRLYEEGALLNTFLLAAKARRLWYLLWKRLPETAALIARCQRERMGDGLQRRIDKAFTLAAPSNFSLGVLAKEPDELVVTTLYGIIWDDWGTPEGVREGLSALGHAAEEGFPPGEVAGPPLAGRVSVGAVPPWAPFPRGSDAGLSGRAGQRPIKTGSRPAPGIPLI